MIITSLFLNVEVRTFPQALNDQFLTLRASIDIFDVICSSC